VPRYLEHPSKVGRWRDGGFEMLPESAAATETVWFSIEPDENGDRVWEGLLALTPEPGRAVIAAVPVFAYDVHLGDEVEVVASAEGPLVALRPLRDAGRHTFRVLLGDEGLAAPTRGWVRLQQDLEPYGCWFDVHSPRLVAVSAEPDVARSVAEFLADEERAGRWQYETGRSAAPEEPRPSL
jgi:hypothetical protein